MEVLELGRITNKMLDESKYVSGISFDYVYDRDIEKAKKIATEKDLAFYTDNYEDLLKNVDAVYIAVPHTLHYKFAKEALLNNKHVLCEKPITLNEDEAIELYNIAREKKLVLYEAIKTAYAPGFKRLMAVAKSGIIGEIKDIDANVTKLIKDETLREYNTELGGGSINEQSTYPLIAILKLLGKDYKEIKCIPYYGKHDVDLYAKIIMSYNNAIATANVGIGVKKEGELVISGTEGYIYVPSPWWKTEYFEVRFEDSRNNKKYYYQFEGEGLRYELSEFLNSVVNSSKNYSLSEEESIEIVKIIENCHRENNFRLK